MHYERAHVKLALVLINENQKSNRRLDNKNKRIPIRERMSRGINVKKIGHLSNEVRVFSFLHLDSASIKTKIWPWQLLTKWWHKMV